MFFVLSGHLIGGRLIEHRHDIPIVDYLCKRTARIYIVLLPALAITVALDSIGQRFAPALYSTASWSLNRHLVSSKWGVATFLCGA